ncbi:metallophosphoesterase [Thermovibrio sp.]
MEYFIADCHFFHKNIVKLNPLKRKEGFEEVILNNLLSTLTVEDVLFVVGDFAWRLSEEFKDRWLSIPGKKVLIKGNHDFWFRNSKLKPYFDEIYDFSHSITVNGKKVLLCHFPSRDLRTYRYLELQERITKEYKEGGFSLLIHGHVHWNPYGVFCGCHLNCVKCFNANVEFINYKPVSVKELPLW